MNMTQAKHAFVTTTCDTCHEAGVSLYMGAASPALQGRPADHTTGQMVAPNDCSLCHTTANWNSTTLPAGHMPNPANEACTVCHTTAPADYSTTSLAANAVLHTGINSSECAQCHGGATALTWYNNFTPKDAVLSPAHIPYLAGASCGSCHSSTTYAAGAFGPMNMTQATHAFVATTCDTCHEKGLSFYLGAASPALQGRPADHTAGQMVAPNDCSLCHTTANWNSTVMPAGHMPNPANNACSVCHTTAPADYSTATLAANLMLHTGITSGECSQCHGGTTAALIWYNAYTPKDAILSPVHFPYLAGTDCGTCHTTTTYAAGAFGPMNMNKALHSYVPTTCITCHEAGLSFYMGAASPKLQGRPSGHNGSKAAPNECNNSGCHNTSNWDGGAAVKRASAAAKTVATNSIVAVVSPRTAALAPGLSVSTAQGFALSAPSHAGVMGNCVGCHNDALARGKDSAHLGSNNACQNCHTTLAWMPARFDHQGVTAICASCHNGVVAAGKPARHIQTAEDCGACHGTVAWIPATFNHAGLSATCRSCHNGITAMGKQIQHVNTVLDCGSCHSTLNWTIAAAPIRLKPLIPIQRGANSAPSK